MSEGCKTANEQCQRPDSSEQAMKAGRTILARIVAIPERVRSHLASVNAMLEYSTGLDRTSPFTNKEMQQLAEGQEGKRI